MPWRRSTGMTNGSNPMSRTDAGEAPGRNIKNPPSSASGTWRTGASLTPEAEAEARNEMAPSMGMKPSQADVA